MYKQVLPVALLAVGVAAHGRVTVPPARAPGAAMEAACGTQVFNMLSSDPNGNIQTEAQIGATQSDYDAAACEVSLCRGYKFSDNSANVQTYTAGQVVPFTVVVAAPHTGVANVSVVDTASNTVIGSPLISWDVYASTATGVTANETSFSVTIPSDLTGCSTAGACVLQWWWDARSVDQTYESCVDFTVGGSSSSGSSSVAATASSTAAATTSSAATTSAVSVAAAAAATTTSSATTLQTVVASSASAAAPAASDESSCSKKRSSRRALRRAARLE